MDKVVGTWLNDKGQTCSYYEDGTFFARIPFLPSPLTGRYTFHNGYYVLESGGSVLSAFQILSFDQDTMCVGLNNGEIHTCQRVKDSDDSKNANNKDWLKPGNRVVLHILKGSASLNGSGGVVKRFDKSTSRYVVFVEKTNSEMKIREANLKPSSSSPAPATAKRSPYMTPNSAASSSSFNHQQQPQLFNLLDQQTALMNQQTAAMLNGLNQYTAQMNQQNEQMLQQLNQQTAQMNQQNAQMWQQLNQQTAQMSQAATPAMMFGNMMNGVCQQPQQPPMYGGATPGFPQPPMHGVVNDNNVNNNNNAGKKPNKFWNAFKQGASQIDPAAAGEFAGGFVQGVGFDISGLGGLFGL